MDWPVNNRDILRAIQDLFDTGAWWAYKGDVVRTFEARFAQAQRLWGVGLLWHG